MLGRHHRDVAGAIDEDAVAVEQPVDALEILLGEDEDLLQAREPAFGEVARQAADADVRVREPRAGQVVQVLEDVVAHRHQVEERGHRAHLHDRCGDAGHVVGDAVVLAQQRAQHDAAARDLDAEQLLDGLRVREAVVERGAVVQAVDVRNHLVIGVVLRLLLETAMQVAAMHVGSLHRLAVELGDDLDRSVRRRVRRADVDDDVAGVGAAIEVRCDGRAGVHGVTPVRYGTIGCSRSIG